MFQIKVKRHGVQVVLRCTKGLGFALEVEWKGRVNKGQCKTWKENVEAKKETHAQCAWDVGK